MIFFEVPRFFVPLNRSIESFFQTRACLEAKLFQCTADVQLPLRLSIRTIGTPTDLAFETRESNDRLQQVPDHDFIAVTEIHRQRFVVKRTRANDSFRTIFDV